CGGGRQDLDGGRAAHCRAPVAAIAVVDGIADAYAVRAQCADQAVRLVLNCARARHSLSVPCCEYACILQFLLRCLGCIRGDGWLPRKSPASSNTQSTDDRTCMTADNPLLTMLDNGDMPDFERIRAEHAEPAIDHLLAAARATIEQCVATAAPTWAALIAPIDDAEERISHAFAPVSHMHSVMDAPAWREAFQNCIAKLTDFNTEQGQNRALYAAVQKLRDSDEYDRLDAGQQRVIDNMLRDFRLSGVALEGEARERYRAIARRL